ncbi:MAG TPA: hypothetical protein VHC68_00155 [Candidatus Paceibacterota bacterium]|nr:hypothetical protein [Candidatus Paceibacterota bacterium]
MANVWSDDSVVINSKNFEIHESPVRRLSAIDCKRIHRARRIARHLPEQSVVIVAGNEVIGCSFGHTDTRGACAAAKSVLLGYCELARIPIPERGVVAVTSFAPTLGDAESLAGGGVDVLFIKEPVPSREGRGEYFIERWIGPHLGTNPELKTNHFADPTAPIVEPRVLIQPRWKAKPWE